MFILYARRNILLPISLKTSRTLFRLRIFVGQFFLLDGCFLFLYRDMALSVCCTTSALNSSQVELFSTIVIWIANLYDCAYTMKTRVCDEIAQITCYILKRWKIYKSTIHDIFIWAEGTQLYIPKKLLSHGVCFCGFRKSEQRKSKEPLEYRS